MEGIVEENGQVDPLATSADTQGTIVSSVGATNSLVTATNIVQLTLPQAQVGQTLTLLSAATLLTVLTLL